jgi:hypothetical protein
LLGASILPEFKLLGILVSEAKKDRTKHFKSSMNTSNIISWLHRPFHPALRLKLEPLMTIAPEDPLPDFFFAFKKESKPRS